MQLLSDSDVPKKYHDQLISVFTSGASREEAETKIKKILGKKNVGYADAAFKCYHIDLQSILLHSSRFRTHFLPTV